MPRHEAGSLAFADRERVEKVVLGIDESRGGEGRPYYGYFDMDGTNLSGGTSTAGGDDMPLDTYGNVRVEFKASLKDRATAVFGDSYNDPSTAISTTPSQPSYAAVRPAPGSSGWDSIDIDKPWAGHAFVEAQIHGPITMDDVARVIVTGGGIPESTWNDLNELGIPVVSPIGAPVVPISDKVAAAMFAADTALFRSVSGDDLVVLDGGVNEDGDRLGVVVLDGQRFPAGLLTSILVHFNDELVAVETSTDLTIDNTVQLANEWRDEMGRFAEKGYRLTAGVGEGVGWKIIDGDYHVSARDRNGNVVWSDDMDHSVFFTSGMRKYRNAIEVANQMDPELVEEMLDELQGMTFGEINTSIWLDTAVAFRDAGVGIGDPDEWDKVTMDAVFQIAAWRMATYGEVGSWDDQDTISALLGDGKIAEAQEAITALYGITPQSGFVAGLNRAWAASSTSFPALALQLFISKGDTSALAYIDKPNTPGGRPGDVLRRAGDLRHQFKASFEASARAYEIQSEVVMDAMDIPWDIPLWRGVKNDYSQLSDDAQQITITSNPLSSWSSMYGVAKGFGSAYSGAVFGATMRRENVFSFGDGTGLGAHGEWEYVMKSDGPIRPGAIVAGEFSDGRPTDRDVRGHVRDAGPDRDPRRRGLRRLDQGGGTGRLRRRRRPRSGRVVGADR